MGLFDKKECSICGAKIGLLGNKKLSDGNMCKDCEKKLSVWFKNRKESSISDIQNQLAKREANKEELNVFNATRAYGEFGCILIDENMKKFVALSDTSDGFFGDVKIVTSIDQIKDKNPDIIEFSQVESVDIDVKVTSKEEKQTVNGEQVSYNPKHYVYMALFYINIKIKQHPFIKSIKIQLNNNAIHIPTVGERRVTEYKDTVKKSLGAYVGRDFDIENQKEFYNSNSLKDLIFRTEYNLPDYSYGFPVDKINNWEKIQEYQYYLAMAEEIKEVLENG